MIPKFVVPDWLEPGGAIQPWIEALWEIDRRGDKQTLLKLLRSKERMPHAARFYVADLIERYQLKRKRGGAAHQTPAYDRSPQEAKLLRAIASARQQINDEGAAPDEALKLAAKVWGVKSNEKTAATPGLIPPSSNTTFQGR